MRKIIVALLSTMLMLQACAFNNVGIRNRSTSISDRMEQSTVLVHVKLELVTHDEDTDTDKIYQAWGSCGGVYIKDNIILTAGHCINVPAKEDDGTVTLKEIWVKKLGHSERAFVVKLDAPADLALLYTDMPGKPVKLADEIVRGQDVWVIGNPLGLRDVFTRGVVSNSHLEVTDEKATFLIVDAVALPGNSGGPIVDTNCHLVGILTRSTSFLGFLGASGLGIGVDSNSIKTFLKSK
jgi:S1-C subfamily serine protease